uniref:NADH:ubiquinone reductase (Non-electrogenic) n=1 Tax=Tetraselmis sp. GSL018 TaxID=582737 RepID=A0A061QRN0_9CHLO
MKVRSHLEVIERGASPSVTVVGGGFSGVELAAVVAERLGPRGSVRLVNPGREILPQADAGQREAAQRTLSGLGVAVVAGARVVGIERGSSDQGKAPAKRVVKLLQDNSQQDTAMETDLVLWTVGSVPASTAGGEAGSFRQQPAFQMPFPTNARGATKTEPTLQVVSHSNVFALGDVSNVHVEAAIGADAHLPQTAQVAFQQADYVAWNVWASINGRPLLPFRYQHLGSMMSLGRTSGAVSLPIPVPPPVSSSLATSQLGKLLSDAGVQVSTGLTLEGSLGGFVRRAAYWYRQPTGDHRNRVGVSWVSRLAKDAADSAGTAGVGSFLSLLQRVASSGQAPRS